MMSRWQSAILERGELYRVGGVVRDSILGIADRTMDDDYLVRGIAPDALEALLAPHGELSFVGRAFGVYKFTPAGERTVDIVYPRREVSTGAGHRDFDVLWDPDISIEDDLRRRDFTMNAIADNVQTGERMDPCKGQADIAARRVRMILPAAFAEDPLRILRGVRLSVRLDFEIEAETLQSMRDNAAAVSALSQERMQEELTRLLMETDKPSRAFRLLHELGVLTQVLPELDRAHGVAQNAYHPDDVFEHSLKSCDAAPQENLAVRWAALLHDIGKVNARQTVEEAGTARVVFYGHEVLSAEATAAIMKRLRYSNEFSARVVALVREHMFHYLPEWKDATVRRFIRRIGEDRLSDLFLLREADSASRDLTEEIENVRELARRVETEIEAGRTLTVASLAISGDDLVSTCGVTPGPIVGRVLQILLERVTDDPILNTQDALREIARAILGRDAAAAGDDTGSPGGKKKGKPL